MLITHKLKQLIMITLVVASVVSASVATASQFHAELLKAADTKANGKYVRTRFLNIIKKPFDSGGKKKALIIGDSHAQDFLNSVIESGYLQDYQLRTRYIPAHCQIYLGENAEQFIKRKDKALCKKSDNLSQAKTQIGEANLIFLVANWKEWAAKALPQTINNLELTSQQKLFVIGRKHFGKISIRNYLRLPAGELRSLRNKVDVQQTTINNIMSKNLSKNVFVDLQGLVCGSSGRCPVFTNNLKLISFDGGHLTKDGAQYVGKILFQNSILANL